MASLVKILRVAADPNRLRILMLLRSEELSVAELQEILAMGQSTISTHLAQLKQAGLVEDRRTGKSNLYRLIPEPPEQLNPAPSSPVEKLENSPRQTISSDAEGENIPSSSSSALFPPEGEGENSPGQVRCGGRSPGKAGFNPYITSTNPSGALAPEGNALNGHDFSRAENSPKSSG